MYEEDAKKILNDKENKISRYYFTEICESDDLEEVLESAYEYVTEEGEEKTISKLIDEMIEHIRNNHPWTTSIEVTNEYLASVVFDATNYLLPNEFERDKHDFWNCDMQCRNPSWDFTMEINEVKEKIGLMDIIHNHLPKYEDEDEDEDEDEIDEYEAKEKIWTEINSILFGNFFDYICIYGAYLEETLLSETETWRRLCREYIWEKSDINKKLNTIEEEHYLKLKKLLEEFRNIHIFFKKNMNPSNPEGSEYKKSQQWLEKFKKEIHYTINTLNTI